jgi:hypothetical protein
MNDALSLCNNQVMSFFRDLDQNDYESLVKRLTPDGVWLRQGKVMEGHDAVRQTLITRSPTVRVHHLITNLMADKITADSCEMRGYMLVVRHDSGKPIEGPAPLSGIENIRTTHITLVRKDGNWLISRMNNDDGMSFSATAKAPS